jgi:hypothetical protein
MKPKRRIEKIIRDDGYQVFVFENYTAKTLKSVRQEDVLALSVVEAFNYQLLEQMKRVQVLTIMDSFISKSDIQYLLSLKKLKRLVLVDSYIEDEFDFSQIRSLEELDLKWKSGYQFKSSIKLKELVLRKLDLEDLSFLSNLKSLETLQIIQGKLTSTKGIEKLKKLQSLSLAYLSKLQRMENVDRLNLAHIELMSFRGVVDFSRINLAKLKWLNLDNVKSTISLHRLLASKSLKKVRIFKRTKLSPEEVEVEAKFSDYTSGYIRQSEVVKRMIKYFNRLELKLRKLKQ